MNDSPAQRVIYEALENSTDDLLISAVAGAGKTTTLVELIKRLKAHQSDVYLLAFNQHIAQELSQRLHPLRASTLHALGRQTLLGSLPQVTVDAYKYRKLAEQQLAKNKVNTADRHSLIDDLTDLVNYTRLTLTPYTDQAALEALCKHYGLTNQRWLYALVDPIIAQAAQQAIDRGLIDFTDMLWLPYQWQSATVRKHWIFIDEAQDLCLLQHAFVERLRAPGGRVIWAGDEFQCIQGFAGSDTEGFERIRQQGARELPLNVSFRCPTSHVALANRIVPAMRAAPNTGPGSVQYINEDELAEHVHNGDMVLCRRTAPLVEWAVRLIGSGLAARISGHQEATGELHQLLNQLSRQRTFTIDDFENSLERYQASAEYKLQGRRDSDRRIQSLHDNLQALNSLYKEGDQLSDLSKRLDSLFADSSQVIILSTIHRAKGLECDKVFLLRPSLLPLRWENQQAWEREQEENIRYVALTRARHTLTFLLEPPPRASIGSDDSNFQPRQRRRRRLLL